MNTFRRLGAETPRLGYRTMDILHVASSVKHGNSDFLTFNQRQQSLALRWNM